jgi:hypothetical protein
MASAPALAKRKFQQGRPPMLPASTPDGYSAAGRSANLQRGREMTPATMQWSALAAKESISSRVELFMLLVTPQQLRKPAAWEAVISNKVAADPPHPRRLSTGRQGYNTPAGLLPLPGNTASSRAFTAREAANVERYGQPMPRSRV